MSTSESYKDEKNIIPDTYVRVVHMLFQEPFAISISLSCLLLGATRFTDNEGLCHDA
jgi:hypothetical protein